MDYKGRLEELIATESSRIADEKLREEAYDKHQQEAFAPLAAVLREIAASTDPDIVSAYIDCYYAKFHVGTHTSYSETKYEIEPNFSGLLSREPEAGFKVQTTISYNNPIHYIDPSERKYVLDSSDVVINDLMNVLAKAIANHKTRQS